MQFNCNASFLMFFSKIKNQKYLLTKCVTFFIAKKVTKNASDPKNSLWYSSFYLSFRPAFSLNRISKSIS